MRKIFLNSIVIFGVFVSLFFASQALAQAPGVLNSSCDITDPNSCGAGLACTLLGSGKATCQLPAPSINDPNNGKLPDPAITVNRAVGLVPCKDSNLFQMDGKGPCLPKEAFSCDPNSLACSSSLTELIVKVIKLLLLLSGMISVLFLILGGFWYMTSAGNAEQAEKGKNTITNFFLGLIIIIMAYALVTIVNNLFTTGK